MFFSPLYICNTCSESESEVAQSCPTLYDPVDCIAHQAPPSIGFSRQEYWSGLPFPSPGDLPDPGIEPRSPTLQADALTSDPPGEPNTCRKPPKYSTNLDWLKKKKRYPVIKMSYACSTHKPHTTHILLMFLIFSTIKKKVGKKIGEIIIISFRW